MGVFCDTDASFSPENRCICGGKARGITWYRNNGAKWMVVCPECGRRANKVGSVFECLRAWDNNEIVEAHIPVEGEYGLYKGDE
jgi:hypothetical protein